MSNIVTGHTLKCHKEDDNPLDKLTITLTVITPQIVVFTLASKMHNLRRLCAAILSSRFFHKGNNLMCDLVGTSF